MRATSCRKTALAAIALVLLFARAGGAQPANTQKGIPNALQGFSQNRDQPVKIQAAALEVREKDKLATFTGDVQVFQGDTEMRCKVLQVYYEQEAAKSTGKEAAKEAGKDPSNRSAKAAEPATPGAGGPAGPGGAASQIKRVEAKGGVTVVQKDQIATGDSATFNMKENTVTLVNNVVVTRGQDIIRGHRLVVDLTTGVSKMDGGRVEGLFPSAAHAAEKK